MADTTKLLEVSNLHETVLSPPQSFFLLNDVTPNPRIPVLLHTALLALWTLVWMIFGLIPLPTIRPQRGTPTEHWAIRTLNSHLPAGVLRQWSLDCVDWEITVIYIVKIYQLSDING